MDQVPLADVLKVRDEEPSSEAIERGEIRMIAKIGFDDGKIRFRNNAITHTKMILIRPGDLVISGINAAKGAVAIYDSDNVEPIAATVHYSAYTPNSTVVNLPYLWRLLRSEFFRNQLIRSVPGGIKTELKPARFLCVPIPLPPLSQQRRLAERIEAIQTMVDEAQNLQAQAAHSAENLIPAASAALFRELTTVSQTSSLGSLTTRITKGESPEWQGYTYQESGPIFIRSENVQWGRLDLSKQVFIPIQFHNKLQRSQLKPGDVLINLVGASIGRSCTVPRLIGDANVNQAVAVISPDSAKLDSNFLMHFLNSPSAQEVIQGVRVETARPNISLTDLRNLSIPVPPLHKQVEVAAYLGKLELSLGILKNLQTEIAFQLGKIMPSTLDMAFKGEM